MVSIDVLPTPRVGTRGWEEIWDLTRSYYEADRPYVEGQLKTHERIAFFRSPDQSLIGMASLDVYATTFQGRAIAVIFTSHVLLREPYRGHNLIQRLGLRTFLATRVRYPLRPIYWFFDTFSYKSYLLLSRNMREYWPRHDRATPPWERGLMHQLAARTYGNAWRPVNGVVTRSGYKRLRADTAPLGVDLSGAPDLEFFARANPGHPEGDMLVCLCPLNGGNWLSIGLQSLRRKLSGSGSALPR
jgi:hypothetical protein